jgi:hypothetical protein
VFSYPAEIYSKGWLQKALSFGLASMALAFTGPVLQPEEDISSVRYRMFVDIDYLLTLHSLDVGPSEMVADGRIKLKSDSELDKFTESGVLFKDGSHLEADVIIIATG